MYVMKVCRGDRSVAALGWVCVCACACVCVFVCVCARARPRVCGVSFTPRPLCRGKNLRFTPSTVYYCRQKIYLGSFLFDTKVRSSGRKKFYSGATVIFRGSACGCLWEREYIFGALGRVVPPVPKTPNSAEVSPDSEFVGPLILSKFCISY